MRDPRLKHGLLWIAGILVVTGLAAWLGWDDLARGFQRVGWGLFIGLCLLQVASALLLGLQWHLVLARLGAGSAYLDNVAVNLAAAFVENVTPSVKLGGEAARYWILRRRTDLGSDQVAGAVLAQKAMSLAPLSLVVLVTLGGAVASGYLPAAFWPGLAVAAALGALLYRLGTAPGNGPGERPAARWWQKARDFWRRARVQSARILEPRARVYLLAVGLAVWLLYPVKVWLVAQGLGLPLGLAGAGIAVFGAYAVNMLPLLPGGLGSYEATMALLLGLVAGHGLEDGLLVALIVRLGTFWFQLFLSALAAAYVILTQPAPEGAPASEWPSPLGQWWTRVTGALERALARCRRCAAAYARLFYQRMVAREIERAGLEPGDPVLHVGCGAFPVTALALSRQGMRVTAVDAHPRAVEYARQVLERMQPGHNVEIRQADGLELDPSGYRAVWVSFHAMPRRSLLEHLLEGLDPGARLIFRNSRGWLSRFYPAVEPSILPGHRETSRVPESLGKETVVLERVPAALGVYSVSS